MTTKKIITETNLKGWKVVGKKMREDQFNQRVDWFAILFCFSVFVKFLCSSDTTQLGVGKKKAPELTG